MKIGIVDSGIHAEHPHVNGIAGGVAILGDDLVDRIGHGTAVAAVIREKAPNAELYAVKVFDKTLTANVNALAEAIRWCASNGMDLTNLSLGTANPAHEALLAGAVRESGLVISAYEWLPGSLPGVIGVKLDWNCPRDECRPEVLATGRTIYHASGYPRPIPGVPPERNLKGISFAVANVTGLIARRTRVKPSASGEHWGRSRPPDGRVLL
ncbi:MAG: S8 family serine peptidase [Bryobacteraceae bacterium]